MATTVSLQIEDNDLVRYADGEEVWRVPLDTLKVLGLYNTGRQQGMDGWMIAWLTAEDMEITPLHEVAQPDEFWPVLAQLLHTPARPDLSKGTGIYTSQVLYPLALAGRQLMSQTEPEKPSLLTRIRKLMGMPYQTVALTDEVLAAAGRI